MIGRSPAYLTSQLLSVHILMTESLLPSLCKREEFPSLAKGLGGILGRICLLNYGFLSKDEGSKPR